MYKCVLFVVALWFENAIARPQDYLPSGLEIPNTITPAPRGITDYGYGQDGAFFKHQHTLFENDNHKLDGTAYAQKNFHDNKPLVTGGIVDYGHIPSRSTFSLGAENTRGFGTDVTAGGQYNFLTTDDGTVGAYGEYSRRFGGPGGTGSPNYEFGVRGKFVF